MKTVQSREEFLQELNTLLPRNCDGVEIGVYRGDFAQEILRTIKPYTLSLVDPYMINEDVYEGALEGIHTAYSTQSDFEKLMKRFHDEIILAQVVVTRSYSYQAARAYANNIFDFIYLDASHKYDDVKRDLKDWLPKLKDNSLMCGHDYADIEGFGVRQAVDEFIKEYNFEMILFNENGGDWALKKKE